MKEDPPPDAKCRDKFLVQSVLVTADKEFANVASLVRKTPHRVKAWLISSFSGRTSSRLQRGPSRSAKSGSSFSRLTMRRPPLPGRTEPEAQTHDLRSTPRPLPRPRPLLPSVSLPSHPLDPSRAPSPALSIARTWARLASQLTALRARASRRTLVLRHQA